MLVYVYVYLGRDGERDRESKGISTNELRSRNASRVKDVFTCVSISLSPGVQRIYTCLQKRFPFIDARYKPLRMAKIITRRHAFLSGTAGYSTLARMEMR